MKGFHKTNLHPLVSNIKAHRQNGVGKVADVDESGLAPKEVRRTFSGSLKKLKGSSLHDVSITLSMSLQIQLILK